MNPVSNNQPLQRIFDLLPYIRDRYDLPVAFGFRRNNHWETLSTRDYLHQSDLVSYQLLHLGIRKGDRVVTISNNRPEFNVVDMGVLQLGAVHVPLSPSITDQKLIRILDECEAGIVFLSGSNMMKRFESFRDQLSSLRHIVSFDSPASGKGFDAFLSEGEQHRDPGRLVQMQGQVIPDDPATIIYISGATTELKGVVLTHYNQVSNLLGYASNAHIEGIRHAYSLLPLAHSFERIINYCQQYFGMTIWYNEKIPGMFRDFREIRPEITVMVPLLIERLFSTLEHQTTDKSIFQSLFSKVLGILKDEPVQTTSFRKTLALLLARSLIFPHWKKALGGRLSFILCGGAALDRKWLRLSHAAGIPIFEGYGITEAGPLVSYNTRRHFREGSVGLIMQGVEVDIAADGEVLVRSRGNSPGYFRKQLQLQNAPGENGRLHTGDLGTVDAEGFLTLTGIKKRIFKLSSGIYVDPLSIEQELERSEHIRKAWVWGYNMPVLCALIVPVRSRNLQDSESGEKPGIPTEQLISDAIRHYNNSCKGPDQVVHFAMIPELKPEMLQDNGELNRQKLYEGYKNLIQKFYS